MSQLKKGALLTYIKIILTNVIGIVMTPLIVSHIGKSEFGIYNAIGALIGTIALFDFGLTNTVVRFVAKYRAMKDRENEENFIATVGLLYLFISCIVIVIGAFFYFYIEDYFTKFTPEELRIAKTLFLILIGNLAIQLPGMTFIGICKGYEAFVFIEGLSIVRYILRSITVIAVLLWGGKSVALVIIDSLFNLFTIALSAYYVLRKLKVRIRLHNFNTAFIAKILKYSFWIFVFSIVSMLQWQSGSWILGANNLPKILGIYGIGITLGTYYGTFSSAISSVFLPRATQMSVNNASGKELTDMMIKLGRLSFMILMYVLGAFILYGEQFINLWVGGGSETEDSLRYSIAECRQIFIIAVLIMIGYTVPLLLAFGNSLLEAKNKVSYKAIIYLIFMFIGVLSGALLSDTYGALGMAVGIVVAWLIAQNIMNYYYHHKIGLNLIRFFKEVLDKSLMVIIMAIVLGYGLNFIPGSSWFNFLLKTFIYSILFSTLMYSISMKKYEKELFTKPIFRLLNKMKTN